MITRIPIDFQAISKETGVRSGQVFFSNVTRSWAVWGDSAHIICFDAPYNKGDTYNGKEIKSVRIKDNHWIITT